MTVTKNKIAFLCFHNVVILIKNDHDNDSANDLAKTNVTKKANPYTLALRGIHDDPDSGANPAMRERDRRTAGRRPKVSATIPKARL